MNSLNIAAKAAVSLIACVAASGCVFSTYDLPLAYQYENRINSPTNSFPSVNIGDVTDARRKENPRMIIHMRNGYGQEGSGGWQAEKPIAEILKDALVAATASYRTDEASNLTISAELLDIVGEVNVGMWSGTWTVSIPTKLTLKDFETGEILWRDTIIGESNSMKKLDEGVNDAFNDLVAKLIVDDFLIQQAKRYAKEVEAVENSVEVETHQSTGLNY